MNTRTYSTLVRMVAVAGGLALAASGCKTSSPAQPSSTASGGTSIISPTPLTPANGTTVPYSSLPVKLTIANGTSTSGSPLTYTFEVGYDAAFGSKAATKSAVAEGTGGQTSTTVDSLLANNTYYWHVRADGGGTTGVFSPTYQFKIGGQVTLGTPTAAAPANGAFVTVAGSVFSSNNVAKSGPVGPITYKFDISTSPTFVTLATTGTVPEGSGLTSFTPTITFTAGITYYWRITANDAANGVASVSPTYNFSVITSVQALLAAEEGLALWPGVQPPGTNGHSSLGPGWDVANAVYVDGTPFVTPQIEALRVFDLIDRGMSPPDALAWMLANGYSTAGAVYYDAPLYVVGFHFEYMAGLNPINGTPSATGQWNLVPRAE